MREGEKPVVGHRAAHDLLIVLVADPHGEDGAALGNEGRVSWLGR
jgi:hypothetical protein